MSCRSSIILEIKECFPPDFAFPVHMWHILSKSEGFSQSPPQLQLPPASEGGLAVSADNISRDAHLCWEKPPTRTSRTPPSDAPSGASKVRRLLEKLLFPQNRATKRAGTELDWCSCHPVSKRNSWNLTMWWMQRVTAAVREVERSCTSVPQDHLEENYQK